MKFVVLKYLLVLKHRSNFSKNLRLTRVKLVSCVTDLTPGIVPGPYWGQRHIAGPRLRQARHMCSSIGHVLYVFRHKLCN